MFVCMSGQCVRVLPAPMVAVWRLSGMWGSVVGSLVCWARGRVIGMLGPWYV